MTTWIYKNSQSEPNLWTVGFYKPDGEFEPESDHDSTEDAAMRVNYLNGGAGVRPSISQLPDSELLGDDIPFRQDAES